MDSLWQHADPSGVAEHLLDTYVVTCRIHSEQGQSYTLIYTLT